MRRWGCLFFLVVLASTSSWAESALDKAAFKATPAELLALAKPVPVGDSPVTILREDYDVSVDDQRRTTTRWRLVFVVRTQIAVDEWAWLATGWRPFYQDKPTIRARVISASGKVNELDPKLFVDAPAVDSSPTVFSDSRRLEAPLPQLSVGAIVEEEIVTTDHHPLFDAGAVDLVTLGNEVPTASTRVTLSAPAALKVHHRARSLSPGIVPRHEIRGGRDVWSYTIAKLPAAPAWEPFMPGDIVAKPTLGLASASSWAAVAGAYRALLDRKLSEGPFVLPSQLPRAPTVATVRAIVAWLHRNVRYTGLELGVTALTPGTPAETVKRGSGDGKDKSTLLVALLRQAGMRADLALLATGPGQDIDPDLPGMGVFDHAIVRAHVAGTDVWIDATEDLIAVGQLPARDQGRRALIVADDTNTLTLTPVSAPQDNLVREVRTFQLREQGTATVTEVSVDGGVFQPELREWLRDTRTDGVRKDLDTYVGHEFTSAKVVQHSSTGPADLANPLQITLVAKDVHRAVTGREQIDVYLTPWSTLKRVPMLMKTEADPKTPRTRDVQWFEPHVYEIENRLILPVGYTPPALVPDRTRTFGTATFSEKQRYDGTTLVVTFRLDTGTSRITPKQLAEVQKGFVALDAEMVHIVIEHTGWALSDRGLPRESIAEINRLLKLHPKEALHHTQLAYVLLNAGAGPAARRTAQRAVRLEPKSGDAHVMLAWVLSHDTLGRKFGFDHDRAAALDAYRTARKLDPKHVGAAVDHATLLQHNQHGLEFGPGADLAGAEEAWRAARAIDANSDTTTEGLLRVLVWSGKGTEAEAIAKSAERSEVRDHLLIVAVALARGSGDAIALATSLETGPARNKQLDAAAGLLMGMRHYGLARALFAKTGTLGTGTPQANLLRDIRRIDAPLQPGKDPSALAPELLRVMLDRTYKSNAFRDDATIKAVRDEAGDLSKELANLRTLPHGFVVDIMRSIPKTTVEGRPNGPWRVEMKLFGTSLAFYAALDNGVAKIIGTQDMFRTLGRHAQRLVVGGDHDGARQCLDWAVADMTAQNPQNKRGLRQVWGGALPRDDDATVLVAAMIGAGTDAIPTLVKCASKIADARAFCDAALTDAYFQAKRWAELDAHALAWGQRQADVTVFTATSRIWALLALKRYDDADRVADMTLAKHPDDATILHARVNIAIARGQLTEAIKRLDAIVKTANAVSQDKNNLAWLRALAGDDLLGALELARAATRDKDNANALNTIAVIEAELGELHAAHADGWRSMELGLRDTPDSADWYLVGRIQEQLGFVKDAIASYKRVTPRDSLFGLPSGYDFARKRLAARKVK